MTTQPNAPGDKRAGNDRSATHCLGQLICFWRTIRSCRNHPRTDRCEMACDCEFIFCENKLVQVGEKEESLGGRVRFSYPLANRGAAIKWARTSLLVGVANKKRRMVLDAKSSRPPPDLYRSPEGEEVEYHTLRELWSMPRRLPLGASLALGRLHVLDEVAA